MSLLWKLRKKNRTDPSGNCEWLIPPHYNYGGRGTCSCHMQVLYGCLCVCVSVFLCALCISRCMSACRCWYMCVRPCVNVHLCMPLPCHYDREDPTESWSTGDSITTSSLLLSPAKQPSQWIISCSIFTTNFSHFLHDFITVLPLHFSVAILLPLLCAEIMK